MAKVDPADHLVDGGRDVGEGDAVRTIRVLYNLFRSRGAFLHAASVVVCMTSAPSLFQVKCDAHLVKSCLERWPHFEDLDVRHQARKPRPAYLLQGSPTFFRGVRPDVVLEQQHRRDQKRSHRDVRDRRLPHHEPRALFREEGLEPLEGVKAAVSRLSDGEEAEEGHGDLGVEVVDEVAGAGAQDGVGGEQARGGEEVGDELDDDARLGEIRRVWGGLVGAGRRAAVRQSRYLRGGFVSK